MNIEPKNHTRMITILLGFCAVALTGYPPLAQQAVPGHASHGATKLVDVDHLVAELEPVSGSSVRGVAHFRAVDEGVEVSAEVEGLDAGTVHGFHIHEAGDCRAPDAASAGEHYAPEGHPHALPPETPRHAGDLGNIQADDNGKATYRQVFPDLSIAGNDNPIIGRGLIVHADPDDGSQPSGNAGDRMACGVIGIVAPDTDGR